MATDSNYEAMKKQAYESEKLVFLGHLRSSCQMCRMCHLGFEPAKKDGKIADQHVFSTMTPSKYMVIGQNPGWDEVMWEKPFVGQAGQNFDREIMKHCFKRSDFYITNIVKCYTQNNSLPDRKSIKRCSTFLQQEIYCLKPRLLITLGSVAFNTICPDLHYQESLGMIVSSSVLEQKVFPVLHPSPLNLADRSRKAGFERQVKLLCGLMRKLNEEASDNSSEASVIQASEQAITE